MPWGGASAVPAVALFIGRCIPYVVVPGNVASADALVDAINALGIGRQLAVE